MSRVPQRAAPGAQGIGSRQGIAQRVADPIRLLAELDHPVALGREVQRTTEAHEEPDALECAFARGQLEPLFEHRDQLRLDGAGLLHIESGGANRRLRERRAVIETPSELRRLAEDAPGAGSLTGPDERPAKLEQQLEAQTLVGLIEAAYNVEGATVVPGCVVV